MKTRLVKRLTIDGETQFIIQKRGLFGWRFAGWLLKDTLEEALDVFNQYNQGEEVIAIGRRKKA